jgi:hypothetical protein
MGSSTVTITPDAPQQAQGPVTITPDAPPAKPHQSYLQMALNPAGSSASAIANPMQPAEQFALDNPEQQGVLATAAGVGAGGAALPEILPTAMLHTVEGAKAVGTWAEANPMKAFLLLNVLKEAVPGLRKTLGFVKEAPSGQ